MTEQVEDKALAEMHSEDGERELKYIPYGITSFAEFDESEMAKQQAMSVKNDASIFKSIVDNILNLDPGQGDKSAMIVKLANEFAQRVQQPISEKDLDELDHYKEVWNDGLNATDEDFQGGCSICQFGEVEKLKEFTKCPYCQNELEVTE